MKKQISIFLLLFVVAVTSRAAYLSVKPSWVKTIEPPSSAVNEKSLSEGYYYFFSDLQINVNEKCYYQHYAYKIYNAQGLDAASTLLFSYNPSYEKLRIHSVKIHRENEILDVTKQLEFKTLQRETGLERNIYDESLTVSAFLDDVRKGDVIEYEYSTTGENPILGDKFYFSFYANYKAPYKLISCRILKPSARKFYVSCLNKRIDPVYSMEGNQECLTWTIKDPKPYVMDPGVPNEYDPYDLIEVSEYNNWKDVADWAGKVFQMNFTPSAELMKKAEEFKKLGNKNEQVMSALHFVQNEIRYLGIEIGVNSHKPRTPNEVFRTRYGDCKDKAQLFCFFISELGMVARPVLVHTVNRGAVAQRAVSPLQFNHVIVEVTPKSWHYYFDPTINQEGGIQHYYTPNYRAGLVAGDDGRGLINFHYTRNFDSKLTEDYIIHSVKGETDLFVKGFYHGISADQARANFANNSHYTIAETYLSYYRKLFGTVKTLAELQVKDSKPNDVFTVSEKYHIDKIWNDTTSKPGVVAATVVAHFLQDEINKININLPVRKDPLYLPHPCSVEHEINIVLPDDWRVNTEPVLISNDYFSYVRKTTYIKSTKRLTLSYKFITNQLEVRPSDYETFKKELQAVKDDLYYTFYYNNEIGESLKSSAISGTTGSIFLCSLLLLVFVIRYIHKRAFHIPANENVPWAIGGILIVGLIMFAACAVWIIFGLLSGNYFSKAAWMMYSDPDGLSYINGYALVTIFELVMKTCFLFFSIYIIILTVKYSHIVPKLVTFFVVIFIVYNIIDCLLIFVYLDRGYLLIAFGRIILSMAAAGILLPSYLTSERAKETFIR